MLIHFQCFLSFVNTKLWLLAQCKSLKTHISCFTPHPFFLSPRLSPKSVDELKLVRYKSMCRQTEHAHNWTFIKDSNKMTNTICHLR